MTDLPGDARDLVGEAVLGDAPARLGAAVRPRAVILGWATVELDRAAEEVGGLVEAADRAVAEPLPDDRVLGARCRRLRFGETAVLLLEPSTEGRLAASLARRGEGFTVRYLLADRGAIDRARQAGFTLTSAGHGPFGIERLVVVGPRSGPFLILAGLD